MNIIVGEWLQLTMDERLRVLEYVVWEQKRKRSAGKRTNQI